MSRGGSNECNSDDGWCAVNRRVHDCNGFLWQCRWTGGMLQDQEKQRKTKYTNDKYHTEEKALAGRPMLSTIINTRNDGE